MITQQFIQSTLCRFATKSNPTPLKDVAEDLLEGLEGKYLGTSPLVSTLQQDKHAFKVSKNVLKHPVG